MDDEIEFDVTPQTRYGTVPSGLYNVTVYDLTSARYKSGKNAGNEYYKMAFEITDGAYSMGAGVGTIIESNKGWMNRDLAVACGFAEPTATGKIVFHRSDMMGFPLVIAVTYKAEGFKTDNAGNALPENVLDAIFSEQTAPPVTAEIPF